MSASAVVLEDSVDADRSEPRNMSALVLEGRFAKNLDY